MVWTNQLSRRLLLAQKTCADSSLSKLSEMARWRLAVHTTVVRITLTGIPSLFVQLSCTNNRRTIGVPRKGPEGHVPRGVLGLKTNKKREREEGRREESDRDDLKKNACSLV